MAGHTNLNRFEEIIATPPLAAAEGEVIGSSREGRWLIALRLGRGPFRVSLLAGCHADEPVGPRLLRHLAAYLRRLPEDDPLLTSHEWWLVPHINPDGEERNARWCAGGAALYDIADYLLYAARELPGDDIEFGFPRDAGDTEARPENRAAYDWWTRAEGAFDLHVSLHGMAFAAGPWFLIEPAWQDRIELLKQRCLASVEELGYAMHDVERRGEKGFFRLGRGFCTRPDSRYMREHFESLGDSDTARLFRPSSMETMRSFGGDPLTLVSEMPLFITPGVGVTLGPPDPIALEWKRRIDDWRRRLDSAADPDEVRDAASAAALRPMPALDQMKLQWSFICAGLEQFGGP